MAVEQEEEKERIEREGRCLNESSKSVGCTFLLPFFSSLFFLGWPVVRVDELQLIVRSLMVGKTQREKSQKKSKKKRRKPDEAGTYELKISYE